MTSTRVGLALAVPTLLMAIAGCGNDDPDLTTKDVDPRSTEASTGTTAEATQATAATGEPSPDDAATGSDEWGTPIGTGTATLRHVDGYTFDAELKWSNFRAVSADDLLWTDCEADAADFGIRPDPSASYVASRIEYALTETTEGFTWDGTTIGLAFTWRFSASDPLEERWHVCKIDGERPSGEAGDVGVGPTSFEGEPATFYLVRKLPAATPAEPNPTIQIPDGFFTVDLPGNDRLFDADNCSSTGSLHTNPMPRDGVCEFTVVGAVPSS